MSSTGTGVCPRLGQGAVLIATGLKLFLNIPLNLFTFNASKNTQTRHTCMEKLNEQDQEIVRYIHMKDQKEQAFKLIVKHYKERLYWHIRKMVISHDDTDDVLQNTFLKVWKNMDRFRGEAALFTWLYRIATNETLTFLQTKQKKQLKTINAPLLSAEEILESDPWFDGNEIQLKLQACLMQLPQRQRLVFNMKYFEEMKYQQISEILKVTVGSLKASYHHAVKKIESILKEEML